MAKKFTVLLLDRELAEHVPEIHHVTAASPAEAIKVLFKRFYDQNTDPDELERLGALDFDLDVLQPIAVFAGHLTDLCPSHKAIDRLITPMLKATRKKIDRLTEQQIAHRLPAKKRLVDMPSKKLAKVLSGSRKRPTIAP